MQWTSAVTETKHGLSDVQLVLFERVARELKNYGFRPRREIKGFNSRTFNVLERRGLVGALHGKTARGARTLRVFLTVNGITLWDAVRRELESKGY